jgi:hypothetical protein
MAVRQPDYTVARVAVPLAAADSLRGVCGAAQTPREPMLRGPLKDGFTLEEQSAR